MNDSPTIEETAQTSYNLARLLNHTRSESALIAAKSLQAQFHLTAMEACDAFLLAGVIDEPTTTTNQ